MGFVAKMRTFACCAVGVAMAIAASLGCLIVWLLVRPFSDRFVAQQWMDYIAATYWRFLVYWVEQKNGIKARFWGQKLPVYENAFVISNHQWAFDWMTLFSVAQRKGRLGSCKFFAKDEVKWIPGFGWGIWVMGAVFVKRAWERDKSTIDETFARLKTMGNHPIWLISWLEGTRISKSKIKRSQAYAKDNNLPVLHHVLLPRTKGFVATVQALRGVVPYLYDITVGYKGNNGLPPDVYQVANGYCRGMEIHYHCRRWDMHSLPTSDDELSQWCYRCFEEKDALLAKFHATGAFPGQELSDPYAFVHPEYETK